VRRAAGGGREEEATPVRTASTRCTDPKPFLVNGAETGLVRCAEGHMHREEAKRCPIAPSRGEACSLPAELSGCATDADCTGGANGRCLPRFQGCACTYSCEVDADCGSGEICLCGDAVNRCVPAECTRDADCGGGFCATMNTSTKCEQRAVACLTADDTCVVDSDCERGQVCTVARSDPSGRRSCSADSCTPGRPFLIGEEARLATLAARADWLAAAALLPDAPSVLHLDASERSDRAAHWARVGQMEHASIAAFARFSMQLLSLGAPASLVEETTRAMHDETVHAKLAFSLASAYAGEAIGPGPLPIDGAMAPASFDAIVRLTIREGCIGETVAALEAQAALENEADPVVARVLARIVDDETRHALLAFRFVQWAATRDRPTVARVFREELDALANPANEAFRGPQHQAVDEVVLPCVEALFSIRGNGSTDTRLAKAA
jgi:hypothetical protein